MKDAELTLVFLTHGGFMECVSRINTFIRDKGFNFQINEADIDSGFHTRTTADGRKIWFKLGAVSDGILGCVFADWRSGEKHHVFSKEELSPGERRAASKFKKQGERDREDGWIAAKRQVEELWSRWSAERVSGGSHYLVRKKLEASPGVLVRAGLRDAQQILVIPMHDEAGELWNVQQIFNSGKKVFHTKARTKGVFHVIEGRYGYGERVFVGEGYATCLAVARATGARVYAAMSCSNLDAVVAIAAKRHGVGCVILLADWDGAKFVKTGVNAGMFAAQQISLKLGVRVAMPKIKDRGETVDFADEWAKEGAVSISAVGYEALRGETFKIEKLAAKKTKTAQKEPECEPIRAAEEPMDALAEIVEEPKEWFRNYDEITPDLMPDRGGKKSVKGTINNLKTLMRFVGATLRYNVIKKDQEIYIPGEVLCMDNQANAIYGRILDLCVRASYPIQSLDHYLNYICNKNPFNPVATWIESKPWDGVSRLDALYSTVTVAHEDADPETKRMKGILIRKWMLNALAAAYSPDGIKADGMLVFQGYQGAGKTAWFNLLVPKALDLTAESLVLDPRDKDSVKQAVRNWLGELGELNATFRKAELEGLKGFLTKQTDIFRAAYAKKESVFPRRTVFFGSVNDKNFLIDETGNRRFWVLAVVGIDYQHQLDMQQIWAELLMHRKRGEPWWLTKAEMKWLDDSNKAFEAIDPIEELLLEHFDWSKHGRDMTATEIARVIGIMTPTRRDLNSIASRARKLAAGHTTERSNRARGLWTGSPIVKR